eukprot:13711948-Heterocapsa_arctica.AAC.1
MEHAIYGSRLEHFKDEAGDRNEWGGAEQIAVFARIHNIEVEVHAYDMSVQVFDGGELELEQTVIRVMFSNSTKWGIKPNHYDLLIPQVEV